MGRRDVRRDRSRSRARDSGRRRPSRIEVEEAPRSKRSQTRRWQRAKKVLVGVLATLIILAAAGAAWGYYFVRGVEGRMQESVKSDESVGQALSVKEPRGPFNLLLLGSDARSEDEAARADTIIVARIDPVEQRVWMISVPRDTRVEITGHGVKKVNAATALGGPALMIDTIEDYLGMPVHHYMEVDFSGFQGIVDAMGGIYIDVDVEINDPKAATHSPGKRAQHIAPGYQLLDGEHALTYVRSRDFPDSDFTRMKHQQNFFKALAQQSVRWGNLLKLPRMASEFSKYVATDMSVGELAGLAQVMRGVDLDGIETATLPGEWRSPFVWVDEAEKNLLVSRILAGESIEETATPEPDRVPAEISVTVRNGAGISGVAGQASARLEAHGFRVPEVGNANQFVYDETLVVFRDDEVAAQMVVDALPRGRLVPSRGMYSFSTDVLVVVGKDWQLSQ